MNRLKQEREKDLFLSYLEESSGFSKFLLFPFSRILSVFILFKYRAREEHRVVDYIYFVENYM
jgi:hypothetical protein